MDSFSAKNIQSLEELRDVYQHFLLYYGRDLAKMKAHMKAKKKAEKATGGGEDGEGGEDHDDDDDQDTLKQASRNSKYSMCAQAGLCEYHCILVYFKHTLFRYKVDRKGLRAATLPSPLLPIRSA